MFSTPQPDLYSKLNRIMIKVFYMFYNFRITFLLRGLEFFPVTLLPQNVYYALNICALPPSNFFCHSKQLNQLASSTFGSKQ